MSLIQKLIGKNNILKTTHLPHEADRPLLKIENVSVRYETGLALKNLTFEISPGSRIAVIGPNGAGKSTLFKVIAGVLKPTDGHVQIYGSEPSGHICIAYVPQRSQVDWNFPANVSDVVMMGRSGKIGILRRPSVDDWSIVNDALDIVDMKDLAKRQISELSGGQQQRVFIARALAQEAELMLLDEPMTGLDANSQNKIFDILDKLEESKITTLVSLHDMKIAREHFEKVMLINKKLLGYGDPQEVFSSQALIDAYQSHLHFVKGEDGQLAVSDMCCPDEENPND